MDVNARFAEEHLAEEFDDLDAVEVPDGRWAVFRTAGPHPQALQTTWAATATDRRRPRGSV